MNHVKLLSVAVAVTLSMLSAACSDKKEEMPEAPLAAPVAKKKQAPEGAAVATDAWIGKWVGVEGLALVVERGAGGPGTYNLKISLMDGTTSYAGTADVDRIRFERNGTEYIRAGKGSDSGLKWLADKNNCLIIKDGEGFCR